MCSFLKIVAEENRLKILCVLEQGSCCVCEIIEVLDIPQSLTSHHLSVLKEKKLVRANKKGRRVHYELTDRGSRVVSVVKELSKLKFNED